MKTNDIKRYLEKNLSIPVKDIKRCKKVKLSGGQVVRSFLFTGNSVATNAVVITDPSDTQILDLFSDVSFDVNNTAALKGGYSAMNPSITMKDFYFAFQRADGAGEWDFNSFIIVLKETWDNKGIWDDSDPVVDIVDDNILVQTMECVYEIQENSTVNQARQWLVDQGAIENTAILPESEKEEDETPVTPSGNRPLSGFYFARYLNISPLAPPSEDDSVILIEKSHWDTKQTWITRKGQSGAELTQEQNRGLPLMPFMYYVHQWEIGYEWENIKGFLEAAGAVENKALHKPLNREGYVAADFVLEVPYPHEPVNQDPLAIAAHQIVDVLLTGEDGDDAENMLWEKPDKFLMRLAAQSKTPLDHDAGRKIIKSLNTMMAIDIVWEDFSTTWAMGISPKGGDESSKQMMVKEILQWATGKLTPADYGRKDDDPSDYIRG